MQDPELPQSAATQPWRQNLMRACGDASLKELNDALDELAPLPAVEVVRAPEIGLVMLRGRIGGDGSTFNVGEATVTRAVVRLASGEVGFSYLLGRSLERARLAAMIDALGQREGYEVRLRSLLVDPVTARVGAQKARKRNETAATRVEFFTLVRGES